MKIIKNNNGYSLLLTFVLIILFSILGMSLLTLTMNGIAKNDTRQDTVRSQELSEKGLDYFVKNIENELTTYIGDTGKPRSSFASELVNILNTYKCDRISQGDSKLSNTSTGDANFCIIEYKNVTDINGKENDLRKLVTIKSTGLSGNADTTIMTDVEIGANTYPDELNYAIGTNLEGKKENGEGNLIINGGAEIKGDIKVEGDLLTYDKAYAFEKWNSSILPRMIPFNENAEKANIVLKGDSYLINNPGSYYNYINKSSNYNYSQKNKIDKLFENGYSPNIVERNPIETKINITDQRSNFHFDKNSIGINEAIYQSTQLSDIKITTPSKTLLVYQNKEYKCNWWNCWYEDGPKEYNKNFNLSGNNSFYSLSINGSLTLDKNNTILSIKKDNNENYGTIFTKHLNIGDQRNTNSDKSKPDITIDGTFYVEGDLNIKGVDLSTNAVMYVNGDVNIQFSTIQGKKLDKNSTGSLVIFSTGNITIDNNSIYSDDPSNITGFFYSEGNFEMKGVGSNIVINGGISADRIVLNAIRGYARSSTNFPTANQQSSTYANNARLKIHYNPDIIKTYSDLRQKEPIIYNIDESVEKSKDYE